MGVHSLGLPRLGHQSRLLARLLVTTSPMSLLATAILPARPRSQKPYACLFHSAVMKLLPRPVAMLGNRDKTNQTQLFPKWAGSSDRDGLWGTSWHWCSFRSCEGTGWHGAWLRGETGQEEVSSYHPLHTYPMCTLPHLDFSPNTMEISPY